jgi:ATP/maltotriose-dependent transcriptional regulator MalT
MAGDIATAEHYLREAHRFPGLLELVHHLEGWVAILRGDLRKAGTLLNGALKTALKMGLFAEAFNRIPLADILSAQGKYDEAARHIRQARTIVTATGSSLLECQCGMVEAQIAFL